MRDHWRRHQWPRGERRLHWLVLFDTDPVVAKCYAEHEPLLRRFDDIVELVPVKWLHMTIQPLCATQLASAEDVVGLVRQVRRLVAGRSVPKVQLGPARIDGGAVTWAVYPEDELVEIQRCVYRASVNELGMERILTRRGRWWPHVTLAYGRVDGPGDDLAGDLARAGFERAEVAIRELVLVDQEQDLADRQYRWREIDRVRMRGPDCEAQ